MWSFTKSFDEDSATLDCGCIHTNTNLNLTLKIKNFDHKKVKLIINSANRFLLEEVCKRVQQSRNEIKQLAIEKFMVSFSFSINQHLQALNFMLDLLDEKLPNFKIVKKKLHEIIKPPKAVIFRNIQADLNASHRKFESFVENTVQPTVFASARSSELALRARFDFDAPMYANDYSSFADLGIQVYSELENSRMRNFQLYLELELSKLQRSSNVYYDTNGTYRITKRSKNILLNSPRDEVAYYALNLTAAHRAISINGSHASNSDMRYTNIIGYGLRNIVALLWHCILKARQAEQEYFMPNITFKDAVNALIKGIADGARGGNRNNQQDNDDLDFYDFWTCDQGRYNSLIEAFNGIFKEVNIIYNHTDLLIHHFKTEIINSLIEQNKNLKTTIKYYNIWSGIGNSIPSTGYKKFLTEVKQDLPNMIERLLNNISSHDPDLKLRIREKIMKEVKDTEENNLGISYIESISPNLEDLLSAWESKNARPTKKLKVS